MKIKTFDDGRMGVTVEEFNSKTSLDQDIKDLIDLIYQHKIVVIKNQYLSPNDYHDLGRRIGEIEKYYQPMYFHPEIEDIFVSSNVTESNEHVGVPKTGKFWHVDYAFMSRPLSFSMVYPQALPRKNRGTYFIDMVKAFKNLPDKFKDIATNSNCQHSVRRYFKIRPQDVYRPVSEILDEIESVTPPSEHPTAFVHPVTGETILYITEGFTFQINDYDGNPLDQNILRDLLTYSGQMDQDFKHPLIEHHGFDLGDLRIWDNRALAHCANHAKTSEPTISFRLTMHDKYPLYA